MFDFYSIFPVFFGIVFTAVLILVISTFVSAFRKERKNDHSPELTVEATVVAKRIHVWGDHSHTDYYATFQVSSGDRMELDVPDDQYGYLVEQDHGQLTFQGTRFLGFRRT